MSDIRENTSEAQPTLIETQLDSISLQLNTMRAKVKRVSMLDHISESERAHLDAALARVKAKVRELGEAIRVQTPA